MLKFDLTPGRSARLTIGGAPEGQDARVLVELATKAGPAGLLHVASDDDRAARLAEALAFFAPELEVLSFPAWDCLPYDRVSPNGSFVARRIATLARLLEPTKADTKRVVLTTVAAIMQRVPPRGALRHASFRAAIGDRVDIEQLQKYLAHNGYNRAQTVREPGEFAVRGGIIDLFPPGTEEPLRLDLFGDELDAVRVFDPLTQRTSEKRTRIDLQPMAEYVLDEPSIQRFRSGYRELFGAVTGQDPLYEAISAGRKHPGMEHWLPLFHPRLETLSDYMPSAILSLDPGTDEARDARIAQIADFYDARRALRAAEKAANAPAYKPLPSDRLYLGAEEWELITSCHAVAPLSPFALPPGLIGQIDAGGRRGHDFVEARARPDLNVFDAVHEHIVDLAKAGRRVMVAAYSPGSRDRLLSVLSDHGIEGLEPVENWTEAKRCGRGTLAMIVLGIEHGFVAPDLAVVTEQDILGDRLARPPKKKRRAANFIAESSSLNPGDFVVHVEYGIGKYDGLETVSVTGAPHDCLRIIYDGNEKLFVPVENIEMLSRYGSEEAGAQLDRLGGSAWQGRKARVKKRLKDMADALLRIAAERELRRGESLTAPEGLYAEFAARFPYPETEDQLTAIADVMADMASGRPMDRLVCGDAGFGKTEIALRAAFVAALSGQQVAVVVPTTLLARQHYRNFCNRFEGLPIQVEMLSRLTTAKDAARAKKGLDEGTVDIVVGTHALLAKGIRFKRLGLVVVDEEQHFGVKQKERLKELRANVHVLTLTATPIPRTLQLALSGVRELTIIATPPVDRLAIRTFVLPYDPVVIREAILREHYRGGQTFYVCPRIEDLTKVSEGIRELVPEVKLVTAHGQMAASELEEVMTAFDDRTYDVLLATNIIESGLDIPNANTMIIHRSDLFGLAQLYQLRGRIGRSKVRGYAYLTYAPKGQLSETARQRLHVIETLDSLGAGFQLASHDMDIRGAGNLLGEEQSGHIKEVGVELYQHMLEEAVATARSGAGEAVEAERWTPQINLGMPVLIPDTYVADLAVRLALYRRIAELSDRAEIDAFAAEMIDRFGKLPAEVDNLLQVVAIKQLCRSAGIERVDAGPKGTILTFHNNNFTRPDRLVTWLAKQAGTVKLRPDHKLVSLRARETPELRLKDTLKLMKDIAALTT
ncbi:MAG: transcription-repair coupling factor [Rhodospirillaceae bacterium]